MAGQINRGSSAGELIYQLSKDENNMVFVELGTWNGEGSTKCFMDALCERIDDCVLYSMESHPFHYKEAEDFWNPQLIPYKKTKLILMLGRIIEVSEMATVDQVLMSPKPLTHKEWKNWHKNYVENYANVNNIYGDLPNFIDVLLLDGGDFSSYAGWKKLENRTKIVLLDDINVFKNYRVNQELALSSDWKLLADYSNERNGFMAYIRE